MKTAIKLMTLTAVAIAVASCTSGGAAPSGNYGSSGNYSSDSTKKVAVHKKAMKKEMAMKKDKTMAMMKDKKMAMMEKMPFSGPQSVAYAGKLWSALLDANLAGPNRIETKSYKGSHPHGAVLQNVDASLTIDGHSGPVLVKSNFGGEGVSVSAVNSDAKKYLKAITVMYQRPGYDPENNNWFWAKYQPDGTLAKNPKGMQLAGRVAKGKPAGCIACHRAAPGGDLVFTHDRFK